MKKTNLGGLKERREKEGKTNQGWVNRNRIIKIQNIRPAHISNTRKGIAWVSGLFKKVRFISAV
ncbi:MAG: hypothetical protein JXR95_14720 [Deltaproteobacteria bacterium]|nr:hypothetical protein [Deltaproteobacteria bacterium]